MPHQCTNCGRVFPDGSKEMLSGCPDCGGNKFQFSPSKAGRDDAAEPTGRREASRDATASSPDSTASSPDSTASSGQAADAGATDRDPTNTSDREPASASDSNPAPNDESGSTTWRRAASRAADAEDDGRPDAPNRDTQSRRADRRSSADGADVDTARRRGQTLREWANSRGFASEVEDENDETTLRENRRRTGDAQRRPPERRSATERSEASSAAASETEPPSPETPESPSTKSSESPPTETPESPPTEKSESATPADPSPPETADQPTGRPASDDGEDDAQASARSEVVSPDEIRAASEGDRPTDANGRVIEPQSDDRPNLDELREELNDQFESIKIVAPGEYELNLMELYDRPEYIISLREDGRYVIEVPDTWGPSDER